MRVRWISEHPDLPPRVRAQYGSGRVYGNLCAYEAGESRCLLRHAAGRLADTAVGDLQRAGDMYQNPATRLRLIEDVGMLYDGQSGRFPQGGTS
jgi:hypothetical protein